jgi:DNA-binding response OmpR family regulator
MDELEKRLKKYTVLYAEDEAGIRTTYEMLLNKVCGCVCPAANGHEALNLYHEKKPDIVIADIKMPFLDGIELAKKIRQNDKHVRILITTAYTDECYTLQAIELDISRYLVKPVMMSDLKEALLKCINEIVDKIPDRLFLADGIHYNQSLKTLYCGEKPIPLTNIESRILEILIGSTGRIVSYEKFETEIWRHEYMSKETLRSHIKSIRKKIGADIIKSSKGIGYYIPS